MYQHPDVPTPRHGNWPCQTDGDVGLPPRLVSFLYRLERDSITPGAVEEHLIQTIPLGDEDEVNFTNPHLEALARSHAAFLIGGGVDE